MAKNKVKATKDNNVESAEPSSEVEQSEELLEVVKTKPTKEDKKKAKEGKNGKKKAKNAKPRRNYIKEVFSELKKVNWPSFKKACKQTGAVLVVVAVFMVVVLGIDVLLAWLMSLVVA